MKRSALTVGTPSGELSGWVAGEGPRVLAIHGGPGMSYDYLDAAAIPERLAGVLSVDPLGAAGDGGAEAFGAEMLARVRESDRARAREA